MGERRSFTIKKGLDLPINGDCQQVIEDARPVGRVALVGPDFHGLRPTMTVQEGDTVRLGQLLFEDKRRPGVRFTSPGGGKVVGVHRGEKRRLLSVEIELDDSAGEETFDVGGKRPADLSREQVRDALIQSGLWTGLRQRPFSKVPLPDTEPHSIFVTAMDTNPLAADPAIVLVGRDEAFKTGVDALTRLTDGTVYVCKAPGSSIPEPSGTGDVTIAEFAGPHPAGLAGGQHDCRDLVWGGGTSVCRVGIGNPGARHGSSWYFFQKPADAHAHQILAADFHIRDQTLEYPVETV